MLLCDAVIQRVIHLCVAVIQNVTMADIFIQILQMHNNTITDNVKLLRFTVKNAFYLKMAKGVGVLKAHTRLMLLPFFLLSIASPKYM